jgi:hypothetical protein
MISSGEIRVSEMTPGKEGQIELVMRNGSGRSRRCAVERISAEKQIFVRNWTWILIEVGTTHGAERRTNLIGGMDFQVNMVGRI